jgi:hypothetical protein
MTWGGGFARLLVIALAGLTAAEVRAEPMPAALRGKSIDLSYTVAVTTKSLGGPDQGQTWAGQPTYSFKLYLSLQGRIFSSYQGDAPTTRNQVSGTGETGMQWRFEDGAVVGYQALVRGARRVAVGFSDQFRSCSVAVIYAKEVGTGAMVTQGWHGGREHEILDVKVLSTTCSVLQGNIFANPQ